jgi:predicted acylesterase/phospholipase RssA
VDVVFEGGGVNRIAVVRALAELDGVGFQPECVAGTSAGAITVSLVRDQLARDRAGTQPAPPVSVLSA